MYMYNITANRLDAWAQKEPRRAQEILPELIIRLILATSNGIKFTFPIEKAIQYPGYDGVIEANEATNYYPQGKIVLEFGTDTKLKDKFKSDLVKRSQNSLGCDKETTTFIFATMRVWNSSTSIEEIINESKNKYNWKDIQIIDASKICLWLEESKPVTIWLANIMGDYIEGIYSAEEYWSEYCTSTSKKLNEEFFLQGRDKEKATILEMINAPEKYSIISSSSKLESILFFLAVVNSIEDKQKRLELFCKILIVTNYSTWKKLSYTKEFNIFLIPAFDFKNDTYDIYNHKQYIIFATSKYSFISYFYKDYKSILLNIPTINNFYKQLELIGFNPTEYHDIERRTKHQFLTLYKIMSTDPSRKNYSWENDIRKISLLPALLIGSWDSAYKGDKEIIEKLSKKPYQDYLKDIAWINDIEDTPILNIDNIYQIINPEYIWNYFYNYFNKEEQIIFKNLIISIFKFEKSNYYSSRLCKNLIITLILLLEDKDYVNSIIKNILDAVNEKYHWINIAEYLPLFMEAAPDVVLNKYEQESTNKDINSGFWQIFSNNSSYDSYYVNILFSFEPLVYDRRYASMAIQILFNIASKEFKYVLANTPLDTLKNIFCIQISQTCLNTDEKLRLLEKNLKKHPNLMWKFLNSLFKIGTGAYLSKSHFGNNITTNEVEISNNDINKSINKLIIFSLNEFDDCIEKFDLIFNNIELYANYYELINQKIMEYHLSATNDNIVKLCDILQSIIHRHRKFANSKWSLPSNIINSFEDILHKIEPKDINKYLYLFKISPNVLNPIIYEEDSVDIKKEDTQIENIRKDTMFIIVDSYSLDVILSFFKNIEVTSGDYLEIIIDKLLNNQYNFDLLFKIKEKNDRLYNNILCRLYNKYGIKNLINLLSQNKELSVEDKGNILCQTNFELTLFKYFSELDKDIVSYYWNYISIPFIGNDTFKDYIIKQLLKYNRPFSAVELIAYTSYQNSELIVQTLEKCVLLQKVKEKKGKNITSFNKATFQDLFKKIYKSDTILYDITKLINLEYAYCCCFDKNFKPKYITNELCTNPNYYIDLISSCSKNDKQVETNATEEKCKLAYTILSNFNTIPGCNSEYIDEKFFNKWVESTIKIAIEKNYNIAFNIFLGKLLSYSPKGNDGIYPHEIIREFLEKNSNKSITQHFIIERLNQRGVYCVTAGEQEEIIASNYFQDAKKIELDYPKTASILREIAEYYSKESKNEYNEDITRNI